MRFQSGSVRAPLLRFGLAVSSQIPAPPANQLVRESPACRRLREKGEAVIGCSFPEPIGCNLGKVAESLFALTQGRLGLLALAHVPKVQNDGLHTGFGKQVDDHIVSPARRSILIQQETLSLDHRARLLDASSESVDGFLKIVRMNKIGSDTPYELLRSVA